MGPGMTEDKPTIPARIGRYRIVRPLSKGGMALVYEGRRDSLGGVSPRVAIKVILPDFAASSTFRELFINEARLGAAMHHQNLVQILDFDSDGDRYFLVMEYVEGLTLSKMIGIAARHDERVPMHVICEIGRQACEGLHYAHQAIDSKGRALNLIHRDIKPSNVIVNEEGGVKILDFGISKGRLRAERSGSVKGTWGYMAPEQANGDRIGPNADVFALGIVLYEMAARKSMFKGKKEEEIRQLLNADYGARVTATLDPSYAPLAAVLARAMHADPKQRFATAAEFGRQLAELLPDPVTVREEMAQFFQRTQELHEAESPPRGKSEAGSDYTAQPNRRSSLFTLDGTRGQDTQRAIVASALLGMITVVAAFVVAYAAFRVVEESRFPAPPAGVEATAGVPVPDVVVPSMEQRATQAADAAAAAEAQAEGDAARPALEPGTGLLTIDVVQPSDVYVDGKLQRAPNSEARVFEQGQHTVNIVSPDGRRVSFMIEVVDGKHVAQTWDWVRYDWVK